MGSFSIFHWIIMLLVLLIWTVPITLAITSARKKLESGFAGWLMLLAVGQTLFLIRAVLATLQILPLPGTYDASVPGATMAYGVETILYFVLVGVALVTTIVMFRRHRTFRTWFTVQWAAAFLQVVLDVAWVASWFHIPLAYAWVEFREDLIVALVSAALSAIAVGYVWRSQRVHNTFVH